MKLKGRLKLVSNRLIETVSIAFSGIANIKNIFLVFLFLPKINNAKHAIHIIKHKIEAFAQASVLIIAAKS